MRHFQNECEAILFLTEGDLSAFNFLYHKYNRAIYTNIFKFVKNETLAEDILQDVFIALWENRCHIKTDIPLGGWLFSVSYNKAVGLLKKRLKESMLLSETERLFNHSASPYDDKELIHQHMLALVEEAMHRLPDKKQEVFRLYRLENKKPEEISKELGLTVISVKDYLKQSTRLIKQYVQLKYTTEILVLLFLLNMIL